MKIMSITYGDLNARVAYPVSKGICRLPTPAEHSIMILLAALEVVNQAGLDGKKLTDLKLVRTYDASKHEDDQIVEIHAKVTHRLKQ